MRVKDSQATGRASLICRIYSGGIRPLLGVINFSLSNVHANTIEIRMHDHVASLLCSDWLAGTFGFRHLANRRQCGEHVRDYVANSPSFELDRVRLFRTLTSKVDEIWSKARLTHARARD